MQGEGGGEFQIKRVGCTLHSQSNSAKGNKRAGMMLFKCNGQPNTLTNRCGSLQLVVTGERIEERDTLSALTEHICIWLKWGASGGHVLA